MTPEDIRLVQESWAKVVPIAGTAADLFYKKLFETDPKLRSLFPTDMEGQKKKLLSMLGAAVAGLNNVDELVPIVQSLGRRHARYRVTEADYGTVAGALLWTLEQGLGDEWNDELKAAWTEIYTVLSGAMLDAAAKKIAA